MASSFMNRRAPAASRYAGEDYNDGGQEPNEGDLIALQAQAAIEEILDESQALDALDADGEELVQVYGEVLPEVDTVLADAQEAGGITVESVALLAIIGELTGTDLSGKVATESFNGQGRSQQATRYAAEAVTDRLNNWWQALKRWLKKIWKKAKDWWNKTFSGAASLKSSAEAMKKRAQGMSSKVIKNENVSFSGAAALVNKDGKIQPADVKSGFKLYETTVDEIALKYPKDVAVAAKKFIDKVADLDFEKGAGDASQTAVKAATTEFAGEVAKMTAAMGVASGKPTGTLGINAMFDKSLGQNASVAVSPAYLGNKVLFVIVEGADIRIGMSYAGSKELDGDLEGKALSISDISGICDSIANTCGSIVRANASVNDTSKVENDLEQVGDKVERLLAQADNTGDRAHKVSAAFSRSAKEMANCLMEPHRTFVANFIQSANAALRYAGASLSTAS